jgi:hypothetical protein
VTSFQQELAELSALTQLYIWQHYPQHARIDAAAVNFDYFKSLATANRVPQKRAHIAAEAEYQPEPIVTPARVEVKATPTTTIKPATPTLPLKATKQPSAFQTNKTATAKQITTTASIPAKNKNFARSPLPPMPLTYDEEWLGYLKEINPQLILQQTPKPLALHSPILVLTDDETAREKLFLQNIAQAISICWGHTCEILPTELWLQQYKTLETTTKLLLLTACQLQESKALEQLYREDVKHSTNTLAGIQLLQLPDLSLHMSQPSLKHALWQTIGQAVIRHVSQR